MIDFQLPDQVIELLQSYSEANDASQWSLGDLALTLRDELCKARGDWQRLARRMAIEASCDDSTVRDRERMARFFEPADRSEFGLSFYQFRACKSAGEDWRKYALWALESADNFGGRPATASVIRAKIKEDKSGNDDKPPRWIQNIERIIALCDAIRRDDAAPPNVKDDAGMCADTMAEHLPQEGE